MATVIRMAPPVAPEPELVPPAADPEEIRACLSSQMRYEFDRAWDFVLDEAKRTHTLAGITDLLATWRLWAYTELKDPGCYYRMLAQAEVILRTGKSPDGSISGDEVKALIRKRQGEHAP